MSITEAAASVAARAFFYPSLAWNIARNRLQDTWHWWDEITETVILGALPFYSTLDQLKALGVTAVVTLNEEFEVFITPEQYQDSGFAHLHIPTVDFLYAPPTDDLHRGADFIQENGAKGGKTYVHCKAGRGRSTTLVLCYLVKYCSKTPEEAYAFVREKRPQVYLAQGQWTAVCGFYLSCYPEKGLAAEDFPYPTFLPIVPGKQGSDGLEPNASGAETTETDDETSEGPSPTSHASEAIHTQHVEQALLQAVEDGETEPEALSCSSQQLGPKGDAVRSESCSADTHSSAVQISASTQPAESDEMVVLHGLGSERSDSEVSVSNIASALTACCLEPRAAKAAAAREQSASAFEGTQPPERAASPAIEIPRARAVEAEPIAPATGSSKGSALFERSASSRGSIQLEPSGSLPGYVRIAPMSNPKALSSTNSHPVIQSTFISTGFTPQDDWAALDSSLRQKRR